MPTARNSRKDARDKKVTTAQLVGFMHNGVEEEMLIILKTTPRNNERDIQSVIPSGARMRGIRGLPLKIHKGAILLDTALL